MGYIKGICVGNDFFYTRVTIFENLMKQIDSSWSY